MHDNKTSKRVVTVFYSAKHKNPITTVSLLNCRQGVKTNRTRQTITVTTLVAQNWAEIKTIKSNYNVSLSLWHQCQVQR